MRRLALALSAALTTLGALVPGPVSAVGTRERPDIVNGFCIAASRTETEKLDELAGSLGGRLEEEFEIIETRIPGDPVPRTSRRYRFADGATATFESNTARTFFTCRAVLPGATASDLDAREFKVQSGYDGWGTNLPWGPATDVCDGGRFLRISDVGNEGLCARVSRAEANGASVSVVDIRHRIWLTDTGGMVGPVLRLCSRTMAEVAQPAFVERMGRSGFTFEGDTFSRVGEDGSVRVTLTGVGCAFRFEGEAQMVARADRGLQAWAAGRGLTSSVSDQTVSGEEGRRIERERVDAGKLSLTWQVFDNFNGRDRPSRLDGVYSTHTH